MFCPRQGLPFEVVRPRSLKSRAMVYALSPARSRSTISRMIGARFGSGYKVPRHDRY
jgi:hypothetical protein